VARTYQRQNCSIARTLELVGERWTLLILRDAFLGVTRFELFLERLGVAPNILAKRLGVLCDGRILERRAYQSNPPRDEYVLTPDGKELFPVIYDLMQWGDAHLAPNGPPTVVRHAECGAVLEAGGRCPQCGRVVGADEAEWYAGPGSRRPPGRIPRPPTKPASA